MKKESYLHPFVFKPREQESVGMVKNLSWGEYQVGEKMVCEFQKEWKRKEKEKKNEIESKKFSAKSITKKIHYQKCNYKQKISLKQIQKDWMRKDEKDWMLSRVENKFVFPEKPRFFVAQPHYKPIKTLVIHVEMIVNYLETSNKVNWSNADEAKDWDQLLPGEWSDQPQRKVKVVFLTEKQWWKVDWIPGKNWKISECQYWFWVIFLYLLFYWPSLLWKPWLITFQNLLKNKCCKVGNYDVFRSCLRTNKDLSWGEFDKWKSEAILHLFLSHLLN